MNHAMIRKILGWLSGLCALILVALGLTVAWPPTAPLPGLFYQPVSSGMARVVFLAAAAYGAALFFLLTQGHDAGIPALLGAIGWDMACQLAGVAGGHGVAWPCLGLDLLLLGLTLTLRSPRATS